MNGMKWIAGLVVVCMAAAAHARLPWVPTDAEMASLPPYCKTKMKTNQGSPEYNAWAATLGKDFQHTHHYCAGINFINRYYAARTALDKRTNLKDAETNLQYMVSHAEPTYSLMPDVYLNLGVVYSLSNRPAQAITNYNKAIELNPRLPKAYAGLADFYLQGKQNAKALEIVTEGLRHNPETRSLQRRYKELGGKLPYPEPVAVAEKVEPVAEPAKATAMDQAAPASDPAAASPGEAAPAAPAIVTPKIGSPTNPYCRFCPD